MKRILIIAILLSLIAFNVAIAASPLSFSSSMRYEAEPQLSQVRIYIEDSPSRVEPGFVIIVEGWMPNGHISIYLVGPKNEQLPVIPKERRVQIKQDGVASFMVPYALKGLYPGRWQLVVAGESGIHISTIVIPSEVGSLMM